MLPFDAIEHPEYKGYWYSPSYDKVYSTKRKKPKEKKWQITNEIPSVQMCINSKQISIPKKIFVHGCLGNPINRIGLPETAIVHYKYTNYAYVPETGEVYSRYNGGYVWKPRKLQKDKNGYMKISLYDKNACWGFSVHVFAVQCMTKKPIPEGHEVDHIEGNRDDNRWHMLRTAPRRLNFWNKMLPAGYMVVEIEEWRKLNNGFQV